MNYKYLIQGKNEPNNGWFNIMSFCPSKKLEEYAAEQKQLHPSWKIRIRPNPKWTGNKDYSQLTKELRAGI